MKRDMDLIRDILIRTEEAEAPLNASDIESEEYTYQEVCYHIDLMRAHGLLDAEIEHDYSREYADCEINGLTWDGFDYLEAIRDPKIWNKTKETVHRIVGSTTMEVIKDTAVMVARKLIEAAVS